MRKNTNYIILPEKKLILDCCKGQATVKDAIDLKKAELSDELYNPAYNIITDFREFDSYINSTNIKTITHFISFLKESGIKGKVAMLSIEPNQMVVCAFLRQLCNELMTIRIEIFSTLKSALRYVECPYEYFNQINDMFIVLNKNIAIV